jgi:hypothetical protein
MRFAREAVKYARRFAEELTGGASRSAARKEDMDGTQAASFNGCVRGQLDLPL